MPVENFTGILTIYTFCTTGEEPVFNCCTEETIAVRREDWQLLLDILQRK
jgi:hypothetical protein